MSALEIWILIALLTVMTILTRAMFVMFGSHVALPDRLQRALRYAPGAALVAIIMPDLATWQGHLVLGLDNYRLIAGVAAIAFYAATRRMLATIALGMAIYTALRLLA
ncbi:AzlD domain-containing protein [Imbroritus primus]|uniref:AzlD domain-containing protein n=1 Tax=Imbroritus primus TaxID=3058603 RepID=A0ACD3SSJ3_9BURK|nr:AzlD domain-containing protein [Burkholderiaceae bacterium PBA]